MPRTDYPRPQWMREGGYCSFSFDITCALKDGENTIVVNAQDELGYLVWDEYPWGNDLGSVSGLRTIIPEWTDLMHRDFNHPALVGWCPLNETYHLMALNEDTHRLLYRISKAIDPTRPSGGMHYNTDIELNKTDFTSTTALPSSLRKFMPESAQLIKLPRI